jgi:oligoribonuclease NrnB/cAMP/cGMP phosphodiesterase (DHH superfamily)
MNNILVLYHSPCADGFGAAWSAWKKLGDTADYKPVTYGQEPPDVEQYEHIYILDFSYSRDVLTKWLSDRNVVVLDHHKSAEEQLRGLPNAYFDMNHSGAYLAWCYFHEFTESVPQLIKHVEDRDLWKFQLPHSREISAWIFSYPYDFEVWCEMAEILER